jgi:hypothetical protein
VGKVEGKQDRGQALGATEQHPSSLQPLCSTLLSTTALPGPWGAPPLPNLVSFFLDSSL